MSDIHTLAKTRKYLYPPGSRVRLKKMDDIQAPPIGTEGTVSDVDDMAIIHVRWDNRSSLGVDYEDEIELISTPNPIPE